MRPVGSLVVVAVLAALGLAGCAAQDRFAAGAAKLRATKPLVEWIDVTPEHVAEVDPARLSGEGAALIVTRSLRESASGQRTGTPSVITLRDVSTSTLRVSPIQRTGSDTDVGWAVLLVPPGQYALNRGATTRRTQVHRVTGDVRDSVVDSRGHAFVPLNATLRIGAGDVVYVGSVIWQADSPMQKVETVSIRDERAAAAAWTNANLPRFAPMLQTRILPPPVKAIN